MATEPISETIQLQEFERFREILVKFGLYVCIHLKIQVLTDKHQFLRTDPRLLSSSLLISLNLPPKCHLPPFT